MAKRQVLPNQLLDGHSWDGFTHRNHLFTAFADDPTVYMEQVERLMDMDMGEDFVSMVEKHSTTRLPAGSDGTYEWRLDYFTDSNYECVGAWLDEAGTVAIASTHKPGQNYGYFYLDFVGNVFQHTELIAGMNPDVDRLLVRKGFNVHGDVFRFQVSLASNSFGESYSLDYKAVLPGTLWSEEAGMVSKYLSDRGVDISFKTPVRAQNELTSFRLQHTIAGHNVDYRPKYFFYRGANGQIVDKPLWISTVEYEIVRKARLMRANIIMHGRSNRDKTTGRVGNLSEAGYEIISGDGWRAQTLASNRHYYSGVPSLTELREIIMDAVIGTTSWGNRKAIVRAGEYGLMALADMVQRELGTDAYKQAWMGDTSGKAYSWKAGNELFVKTGQVMGIALVNGIELVFMLDASKDNPGRNKVKMPNLPGYVSSYQYDIVGLGGKDADSNMEIVRVEGRDPIFGALEGMRGFHNGATSFKSPKALATAVDGATIHYFEPGVGAKVKDPTRVVQYYPDVLIY